MAKKKLAKVQDIPGMKIYDGPDGPEMCATDKRGGWPDLYMISLNELGLGDDVDKRIWEAMLPQMRKHLGGESSIFDGIQYRGQFDAYSEAGNALLESAVIDPCLDEAGERDFKIMCLLCGKTTAQDVPAPADDNNFGYTSTL